MRTKTNLLDRELVALQDSLTEVLKQRSLLQDSTKAVRLQLNDLEGWNENARLQLSNLNDSIEKVVGPIKDILDAGYESYISIHWRTQMAGDDSFKIYVIDENWNPAVGAFMRIPDTTDLNISRALPDSTNSKGELGFKVWGAAYKDVTLYVNNNDPVPQEIPMLIGPSLRYRVLLKRRYRGSD